MNVNKIFFILFTLTLGMQNHVLAREFYQDSFQLIQDQQFQKAADLLEKEFSRSKDSKQQIKIAQLIVNLSDVQLKQPKRYYAGLILRQNKNLEDSEFTYLVQLAGDGYFDEGDLKRAHEFYQMGTERKGTSDSFQIYVHYKWAWVLMNQEKIQEAILSIESVGPLLKNSPLRENIIRDYAQFQGELLLSVQGQKKKLRFTQMPGWFLDSDISAFATGYLQASHRLQILDVRQIRDSVLDPKIQQALLTLILEKPLRAEENMCGRVVWKMEQIPNSFAQKDLLLLNACSQKIIKSVEKQLRIEKMLELYQSLPESKDQYEMVFLIYDHLGRKDQQVRESLFKRCAIDFASFCESVVEEKLLADIQNKNYEQISLHWKLYSKQFQKSLEWQFKYLLLIESGALIPKDLPLAQFLMRSGDQKEMKKDELPEVFQTHLLKNDREILLSSIETSSFEVKNLSQFERTFQKLQHKIKKDQKIQLLTFRARQKLKADHLQLIQSIESNLKKVAETPETLELSLMILNKLKEQI